MTGSLWTRYGPLLVMALGVMLTVVIYVPGLSGGFIFDDYPNIVDNRGVQPSHADATTLMVAALSSPSSELKRPLASLTFAANYLATGLDAGPMKVTNLLIHVINGLLAFAFVRSLLIALYGNTYRKAGILAGSLAAIWMVLPINVTVVLYVVQRMESLANAFILAGLWAYVVGRHSMRDKGRGFWLAVLGIVGGTTLGILSKESAVVTPLLAALVEVFVFRGTSSRQDGARGLDKRIPWLFAIVLIVPGVLGLLWLIPSILSPAAWATRDFSLGTRLLSEARIVIDYIGWTLVPLPEHLSFYHDNFVASKTLIDPVSTLFSILGIVALIVTAVLVRTSRPLLALAIALYLCAHLLTATVIPLELVYEHRNYFPSLAVLLALSGLFFVPEASKRMHRVGILLMGLLAVSACAMTLQTAVAWGTPLGIARELAERAPNSPRAQYELGRAYIIDSRYDASSPSVALAYPPLERAAALPRSSILPLQALIFLNARMNRPIEAAWWEAMEAKLKARRATVEDESSLLALTQCMQSEACKLPTEPMQASFDAAASHDRPSGRLLAGYANFAWNLLHDHAMGERLQRGAVSASPMEPVYRASLVRFQLALGELDAAETSLHEMEATDFTGTQHGTVASLHDEIVKAKNKQALEQ